MISDWLFPLLDMGKFMKPGKVVMVLAGRYAGRKAVIVKVQTASLVGVPLSKHGPGGCHTGPSNM